MHDMSDNTVLEQGFLIYTYGIHRDGHGRSAFSSHSNSHIPWPVSVHEQWRRMSSITASVRDDPARSFLQIVKPEAQGEFSPSVEGCLEPGNP